MTTVNIKVATGMTLPNGAQVILAKTTLSGKRIVLCIWERPGLGTEYVTWVVDGQGNAYWGHYHQDDGIAALADYNARS